MEIDVTLLKNTFQKHGIDLSDQQQAKFVKYYELLSFWNNVHNLTTVTEWSEVIRLHFLDSVMPYKLFCSGSVIDIGAGAGFPSIPLAIMTECNFVALDSVSKKVDFMNLVARELNLSNFTAVHARAEEYVKLRKNFDYAVSRAVAPLNVLSEYCIPYLSKGGKFIAYKSRSATEEIEQAKKAVSILGGDIPRVLNFDFDELSRSVVIVNKIADTPSQYPRGGNKPRLKPL